MAALPLMLEEAQFAADFMELYLPPEPAPTLKLTSPTIEVCSCSFARTATKLRKRNIAAARAAAARAACCGLVVWKRCCLTVGDTQLQPCDISTPSLLLPLLCFSEHLVQYCCITALPGAGMVASAPLPHRAFVEALHTNSRQIVF